MKTICLILIALFVSAPAMADYVVGQYLKAGSDPYRPIDQFSRKYCGKDVANRDSRSCTLERGNLLQIQEITINNKLVAKVLTPTAADENIVDAMFDCMRGDIVVISQNEAKVDLENLEAAEQVHLATVLQRAEDMDNDPFLAKQAIPITCPTN